jgi:hypothetical protein
MIVAVIGWVCGVLAFTAVARWIGVLFYARTQVRTAEGKVDLRRAVPLALAQSLFHAGPYTVATLCLMAYFIRNESWAPWLFGGIVLGFGIMSVMTGRLAFAYLRSKANEPGKTNDV